MYDKTSLSMAKLHDDTNSLKHYNNQMLALAQKEFYKKNIDFHGYERFVNIIQCMNLRIDEMKENINVFIDRRTTPGMKFDVSV